MRTVRAVYIKLVPSGWRRHNLHHPLNNWKGDIMREKTLTITASIHCILAVYKALNPNNAFNTVPGETAATIIHPFS
jgi:hypothetical protein